MTDKCSIQTKNYTKCFTKAKDCEAQCSSRLPGLAKYIFDYFKDITTTEPVYCLFHQYIIIPVNGIDTEDISKEEFDYIMKGFDEIKQRARTGSEEPLLADYMIATDILKRFERLRNVLFTKYGNYVRDIVDMLRNKCVIQPCSDAYIDLLLWKIYKVDILEELFSQNKETITGVVDTLLGKSSYTEPIVQIKESYFMWFLDTIEANSDFDITKARRDGYSKTIVDENYKKLWKEFNKILKEKLRHLKQSFNDINNCKIKLNKQDLKTRTYNTVNKHLIKDYYDSK
jgi:hypothetical protein